MLGAARREFEARDAAYAATMVRVRVALGLGLLLDVLVQWASGRCIGLWCYF